MKITGKFSGTEEMGKRFYLPGLVFKDNCPQCNESVKWDGADDYISHPIVGSSTEFNWYCPECDTEWDRDILITLSVKVLKHD